MQKVFFDDWGVVEYGEAWQRQEAILKEALQIKAEWHDKPAEEKQTESATVNKLFFCEHPHVYTLGKSGHIEHLLVNDTRLKELNVSFYKTNRGGDITYHGPGQIVGYPILDLEKFETDLGKYMRSLEEVIIRTLDHFGIKADRLPGATGVWIEPGNSGRERKICAMGVRCSRWVTMHGFALNVNSDMSFFDHIVPCGLTNKKVASMQRELNGTVSEEEVKEVLKREFGRVFFTEILPLKV